MKVWKIVIFAATIGAALPNGSAYKPDSSEKRGEGWTSMLVSTSDDFFIGLVRSLLLAG